MVVAERNLPNTFCLASKREKESIKRSVFQNFQIVCSKRETVVIYYDHDYGVKSVIYDYFLDTYDLRVMREV